MAQEASSDRPRVHRVAAYQPVPLPAPAHAWLENEERDGGRAPGSATSSPGESRRLLPAPTHKSRLQAGLTLSVHSTHNSPKKQTKCSLAAKFGNTKVKTRSQKRKDKIIAALKPPYFILSMIIVMVSAV